MLKMERYGTTTALALAPFFVASRAVRAIQSEVGWAGVWSLCTVSYLLGALFTSAQQQATAALASRLGWPVLPDVCSGLRSAAQRCGVVGKAPLAPLYDVLLRDNRVHS